MFFYKFHNIVEVCHVLTNKERSVTSLDRLVMNDWMSRFSDRVSGPASIGGITEVVSGADEHGDWDLSGVVVEGNLWWVFLTIMVHVSLPTPVVELELLGEDHLTVVDQALDGSTSWEMAHIHIVSDWIVQLWVLGDQKTFTELAELWN